MLANQGRILFNFLGNSISSSIWSKDWCLFTSCKFNSDGWSPIPWSHPQHWLLLPALWAGGRPTSRYTPGQPLPVSPSPPWWVQPLPSLPGFHQWPLSWSPHAHTPLHPWSILKATVRMSLMKPKSDPFTLWSHPHLWEPTAEANGPKVGSTKRSSLRMWRRNSLFALLN